MKLFVICMVWLLAVGVVEPVSLWAQRSTVLEGERIRIRKPKTVKHFYGWRDEGGEWTQGTFVRTEMNVLHFRPDGYTTTVAVPRDSVFRMEKRLGMATRMRQGAWIGALVGLGIGIGVGASTDASSDRAYSNSSTFFDGVTWDVSAEVAYGFKGLLIGLGVGAIVGGMLRVEKWERVEGWDRYLPGMMHSLNVAPTPEGWQMCFSKGL